ncbi:hypothetical protein IB677_00230 [Francisella adeliensis]|nr:hypothetical protein [Francisella adeliensis]
MTTALRILSMDIIESWSELDFETTPFLNNVYEINQIIEPLSNPFWT